MADREQARERDLDRFLTLVDAVVAIAITLLVLPLVDLTSEVGGKVSVADLLREHQAEFWAFLLSFAVIARLWFAQHRTMRHVLYSHHRVDELMVLWMLAIVFLPFPTALVAEAPDSALTKVLYIGTMVLGTVCLGVIKEIVVRRPELLDGRGLPDPALTWASAGLMLIALAITLAVPATSYLPLLLLMLADNVVRWWRRLRRGGSGTGRVGG